VTLIEELKAKDLASDKPDNLYARVLNKLEMATSHIHGLEAEVADLYLEIDRLREYEWMYKDLTK